MQYIPCVYSISPSFALEEAKRNVDKFLVIGVMEEYELSMAVFEKLLPETFGGGAKIYEENKGKLFPWMLKWKQAKVIKCSGKYRQ